MPWRDLPSSYVLFSLYLTLPVIFFSSPFSVYLYMALPVMGLVSCQVSSLLALSVSQRSGKRELGVGLSLPLATEVSFSPSIIHILFNQVEVASQHSARRYIESPQQDKHGHGLLLNVSLFFEAYLSEAICLLAAKDTEQLYVWLKNQNLMIRVPSVKNIVHSWHKVINIFMNEIIVSSNIDSWKTWYYCFLINANALKLFSFSCLKRENANHLAINYKNTQKCVVFLCLLVWFFLHTFFFFLNLLREKKSEGSTTLPALDKKDQTVSIHPLIPNTHTHTHMRVWA